MCVDQSFLRNKEKMDFNNSNCLIFLLAVLSFHRNYKTCQDLNHQYDLNSVEILSCKNEINEQNINIVSCFNLSTLKNNNT